MVPPPAKAAVDAADTLAVQVSGGGGGSGGGSMRNALAAAQRLSRASEDRLLKILLVVSALAHAAVFLVQGLGFLKRPPQMLEDEWASIDADLLPDVESTAPMKTALPQAQQAPEAKVPEQMLPQLPKKVSVQEQTKEDEAIAEEKIKEEEKKKEEEEKLRQEAEKKAKELEIQKKKEEDNKMQLAELQKRAALEKLRKEEKTAKQMEAPEKDPLAKIAELVNKNDKLNKGAIASASIQGKARKYGALLKAAVQQNYSIPEAYNLKGASLKVMIAIAVNDRGELADLRVEESSGDPGFDALTMEAVKASVPLPRPPPEMAGQSIVLMFTP